jgi:hypothetical protein
LEEGDLIRGHVLQCSIMVKKIQFLLSNLIMLFGAI